jgi:NADH:ubiquinone oxidoreductase subunit 6 (subunit J)
MNDILLFSDLLYKQHASLFILNGMILLAAMIGAIVLALSTLKGK